MKIQTADGKIFDVPEQNVEAFLADYNSANNIQQTGMDAETKATLEQASQDLRDLGYTFGTRGNNAGGALRNFAMSVIPGTAEIESALRATKQYVRNIDPTVSEEKKTDESWSESYDKYYQNALESRKGYSSSNPMQALGLQVAGGIAGALLPFGVAAKATTIPRAIGRSGLVGTGTGAAFGFGNAEGGLEERLKNAGVGAGLGLVAGTAAPIVGYGIGGLRNTFSRLKSGYGKAVPQSQVEGFILSDALQPNVDSREIASTLGLGSARGAKDIEKAGFELLQMRRAMDKQAVPSLYTGKTSAGTTAKDLLSATQHPSMTAAKKEFGDFMESLPTLDAPARPAQALLKNNKSALKILDESADKFTTINSEGVKTVLEPSTARYWQKVEQALANKLPKKYTPSKLTGSKKDIYNAVQQVSKTREKLFPGTQSVNERYASAIADQRVLDEDVLTRLKTISKQQEPMGLPGGALPTIGWLFGPSRQRGISRELIRTGTIREPMTTKGVQTGGTIADSIIRALQGIH